MSRKPLTKDELHTIRLVRAEGWSVREISKYMHRDTRMICDACRALPRVEQHRATAMFDIPDYVLADRDRRLALHHKDLVGALMGDPLR